MQEMMTIDDILEMKSNLIYGEEAIAWQKTSKVGEQMVALFDKCKAYREKHFIPEENNWKVVAHDISKIIDKELPPLWKKELGLNIKQINFNCEEPSGFVAIDYFSPEDLEAVYYLHRRSEGSVGKDDIPQNYIKRIDELVNKAKGFDQIAGKLKGKEWGIILYIDVTLFFFYDLFSPKSMVNDGTISNEITSREATGILLHEAGHAMIVIERIAYGFSAQLMLTNMINGFFKSNPSLVDMKHFCTTIVGPMLNAVINDENNDTNVKDKAKFMKEVINKIVSFCDYAIAIKEKTKTTFTNGYEDPEVSKISETANSEDYEYTGNDNIFQYGFLLVIRILLTIMQLLTVFYIPMLLYKTVVKKTITFSVDLCLMVLLDQVRLVLMGTEAERHNSFNNGKSSDIKGTAHQVYLMERSADEHATRHGFGGDLASGLMKIRGLFAELTPTQNTYIRNSKLLIFLARISDALTKLIMGGDNYSCYEWDDMRIRRICQNCISFFKNTKVSPQYRDNMLATLNHAMDSLDKLDRDIYNRDKMNTVIKIIRTLIMPAEWIKILTSGRLTQEYEQHINQIEDLSNNLMFAHSAQFKKMLDNMKKKK